jgi:predicted NodU family carbamoyl transferase
MLANTSFNESEPIVASPEDALETFAKTRIDLLVLGNYVVRRSASAYAESSEPAASAHE